MALGRPLGVLLRALLEEGLHVLVALGVTDIRVVGLRSLERVVLDADQVVDDVIGRAVLSRHQVSCVDCDRFLPKSTALGKPVQFGYKAQVVDNEDGVVLDHNLEQGNPPDAPQLAPAVERIIKRTGRKPRTATTDRGYGKKSVEDALHDLGVRHVVIPRKGKLGKARQAEEHRPAFRNTVKWRTGSEGRISSLKRGYGWDRTRLDGTDGARIWTGQGVFAHNLVKIGALAS